MIPVGSVAGPKLCIDAHKGEQDLKQWLQGNLPRWAPVQHEPCPAPERSLPARLDVEPANTDIGSWYVSESTTLLTLQASGSSCRQLSMWGYLRAFTSHQDDQIKKKLPGSTWPASIAAEVSEDFPHQHQHAAVQLPQELIWGGRPDRAMSHAQDAGWEASQ